MAYNLRSRGPVEDVPDDDGPDNNELDMESEGGDEESDEDDDDDDEEGSDVESDPFYGPFLENELLMNIGRIMRYELSRNIEVHFHAAGQEDDDDDAEPPPSTRVVPEGEDVEDVAVVAATPAVQANPVPPSLPPPPLPEPVPTDPTKLTENDFDGLPRYRLALLAVRHFEHTGIRNVYTASSMPNADLLARLCQIPRGVAVNDCSICSFPMWDFTKLRCCGNDLCVHCMYRCQECPYCRSMDGF